jgi:META domain-containing protein
MWSRQFGSIRSSMGVGDPWWYKPHREVAPQLKHRLLSGVIALAVVGFTVMVCATEAQGSGVEALGDRYDSIAVARDGEPHELVEGTRIRLRFEQREGYDVVSWRAGCNYLGARVEIGPWRLITGQISGTEMGCSNALLRQDEWLARFFRRDPRWTLRGTRLRLRSGDDVIRLRRRTESGFCPATRVDGAKVRAGPFVGLIAPEYDVLNGRFRLRVGAYRDRTTGLSQKILWRISRQADVGMHLRIDARRLPPLSPRRFHQELRRTAAVGDRKRWFFPSIIKPPAEGCWRLRFRSGTTAGSLIVLVRD